MPKYNKMYREFIYVYNVNLTVSMDKDTTGYYRDDSGTISETNNNQSNGLKWIVVLIKIFIRYSWSITRICLLCNNRYVIIIVYICL